MSNTTLISVRVTKEVARRLEALAEAVDCSKSCVAAEAIEEFLASHEWQVKAIRHGLSQADAGKLVGHEQARKRLGKWCRRGD